MSKITKILVPIKRVIDYRVKVRVKADKSGIDLNSVKMSINPFDEIAVEEALRIKERYKDKLAESAEVILVTVGGQECQETLRAGLALGADRAILLQIDNSNSQDNNLSTLFPLAIAKILKDVIYQEKPDLVILGKQSIDGDNNQTGQMLAGLLKWPQVCFASQVDCHFDDSNNISAVDVTREVDGGLQTLQTKVPAVITTDLRLNEPRFASLPNIMKSKSKPLDIKNISLEQYTKSDNFSRQPEILDISPPEIRQAGDMVSSVDELIEKLHSVEKII